ncbi:hypothetical protein HGRIS_008828 [Hohenbuehelia grisea]|uniref:Secreted protein n=1 Tax=Hohenbuehelia grisea TaxID=104357 RepID=A0ABR3IZA4_9AGAR
MQAGRRFRRPSFSAARLIPAVVALVLPQRALAFAPLAVVVLTLKQPTTRLTSSIAHTSCLILDSRLRVFPTFLSCFMAAQGNDVRIVGVGR